MSCRRNWEGRISSFAHGTRSGIRASGFCYKDSLVRGAKNDYKEYAKPLCECLAWAGEDCPLPGPLLTPEVIGGNKKSPRAGAGSSSFLRTATHHVVNAVLAEIVEVHGPLHGDGSPGDRAQPAREQLTEAGIVVRHDGHPGIGGHVAVVGAIGPALARYRTVTTDWSSRRSRGSGIR